MATNAPANDDVSAIKTVNDYFVEPVKDQSDALKDALDNLKADTSNAASLADYQARLAEYNITRNAQSTSIKVVKDLAMSIIGNMR
ncbi:type III secretion system needle filament subunit SctF [Proteus hauseri]|uniref:type III secretion system needle filament subunit SctF n=1 Tax=Proteus hauseri TaxID=183417 RepID=UPI0032DBEC1C